MAYPPDTEAQFHVVVTQMKRAAVDLARSVLPGEPDAVVQEFAQNLLKVALMDMMGADHITLTRYPGSGGEAR